MVNFEKMFKSFALGGLLIISILAFGITMQEDNDAPEKITDVPILNDTFNTLKTDLQNDRGLAQSQQNIFETEEPKTGFGSLLLFSIVSAGKTFTGMIIGVFNLLIYLPMAIFGVDPVVASVLSTILIISFILGLWIVYKLGG